MTAPSWIPILWPLDPSMTSNPRSHPSAFARVKHISAFWAFLSPKSLQPFPNNVHKWLQSYCQILGGTDFHLNLKPRSFCLQMHCKFSSILMRSAELSVYMCQQGVNSTSRFLTLQFPSYMYVCNVGKKKQMVIVGYAFTLGCVYSNLFWLETWFWNRVLWFTKSYKR